MKHRRVRRRLPILRLSILAVSVGFFVWAAGFYRFAQLIPEPTPRSEVATDAIVVLTGGTRRVGEGLSLLERGLGKKAVRLRRLPRGRRSGIVEDLRAALLET